MSHDLYDGKFSVVVSCENTAYMAWQAKLFFFSCYSQLDHSPIIVVHGSTQDLHAGYLDIIDSGGNVVSAPSYRLTKHNSDYPPRNTPGTLLHVAEMAGGEDGLFVLCDPDMIFVGRPNFPRSLSANHYSYMNFKDHRIHQYLNSQGLAEKFGKAPVEKLRCGAPYVIPTAIARELAIAWIDRVDEFQSPEWIDMMYAFGMAVMKLGYPISDAFDLVEANFYKEAHDGTVVHYCYGDDLWNKRRFMTDESVQELWSNPVTGPEGSALGEIGLQLRAARKFYRACILPQSDPGQPDEDRDTAGDPEGPCEELGGLRRLRGANGRARHAPAIEDEILIACSRLHLDELHRDRVILACERADMDWELVYSAACAHKIAPLVYQNLRTCGTVNDFVPRKLVDQFQEVLRWNALKNAIATNRIAEMATFFDSRSHDILLLKHAAFSVRLPSLYEVTMSDDIDVVVRPKGELPDRLAERYAYSLRPWHITNDRFRRLLRPLIRDGSDATDDVLNELRASGDPMRRGYGRGVELENRIHHDVMGVGSIDFRRVWEDAIRVQTDGKTVCVPSDHDLIIINSVNLHRKPYPRLRNIVEINELIGHGEAMDWDAFTRKVRDYRCNSLVYSALTATQSQFESNVPESVLKSLRPGRIRGRAIALINQKISPTAIFALHSQGSVSGPRRSRQDLARRFLAYNGRQLVRFIWLSIILHRILGILKDRPSPQPDASSGINAPPVRIRRGSDRTIGFR